MGRRVLGNRLAQNAITAITVSALALGGGGCSFLFSEGAPPDHDRRVAFDCGESVVPPVLDSVATGLFTVAAIGTGTTTADIANRDTKVAVVAGFAALSAASAIFGYVSVSDCRDARERRAAQAAQARALPPPYGVPPAGAPPRFWPPGAGPQQQ